MPVKTQTKDGKLVPAQPIPYYKDSRSISVKLWHCLRAIRICFIRNKNAQQKAEDELEKKIDKYMVPVEPYTDDNGKWHTW